MNVRVVEVEFDVATAHVGWFLASLGAQVCMIDSHLKERAERLSNLALDNGDEVDRLGPLELGSLTLLAGKDLLDAAELDDDARHKVLTKADLILTCGSPRDERSWVNPFALRETYPTAVIVSVTPFGLTGPRAEWKANDFLIYHAGIDAHFLPPGPTTGSRPPVAAGDFAPGRMVGWAILAPILSFVRSRRVDQPDDGALLEISKQEALLDLNRVEISRALNNDIVESRLTKGYETGGIMFGRDKYVVVMPLEDHHWTKLFSLLGNPEWTLSPEYATRRGRREHAPEIQALLQGWAADHDADELYGLAQAVGVPVGVVRSASDILGSPQVRARHLLVRNEALGIQVVAPGLPYLYP